MTDGRTNGWTDAWTDGRAVGHDLLQRCVVASKKCLTWEQFGCSRVGEENQNQAKTEEQTFKLHVSN